MTNDPAKAFDVKQALLIAWQAAEAKAKAAHGAAQEAEFDADEAYVAWLDFDDAANEAEEKE